MQDNGHYRCYIPKKFTRDHLDVIEGVNKIVGEYESKGFSLTLRQIYYQFVARDWLVNSDANYKRLGDIVSDGRMAGLISWTAIEDRGRNLRGHRTFDKPVEAMRALTTEGDRWLYRRDLWEDQPFRPEVRVEKAALEGVVGEICDKLRVDFYATKGYDSMSEAWRAGQRLAGYVRKGQRPIIFYLGDHDPSGIDMTRDNEERLSLFAGVPIMVQRLALNMPQIEQYNPPPNPLKVKDGKLSDSRAASYLEQYGESSWELDALDPQVIQDLIEQAILKIRDESKWDATLLREVEDKRLLEEAAELFGG